jgi:hypothetical protein
MPGVQHSYGAGVLLIMLLGDLIANRIAMLTLTGFLANGLKPTLAETHHDYAPARPGEPSGTRDHDHAGFPSGPGAARSRAPLRDR